MSPTFAVLALIAVAGEAVTHAGSSSAQMTVSVTVVRSCAVDTRIANDAPVLRLTCAPGAQSTLKVSETVQQPSTSVSADGRTILTLNF
jgi:hypothetical protein